MSPSSGILAYLQRPQEGKQNEDSLLQGSLALATGPKLEETTHANFEFKQIGVRIGSLHPQIPSLGPQTLNLYPPQAANLLPTLPQTVVLALTTTTRNILEAVIIAIRISSLGS